VAPPFNPGQQEKDRKDQFDPALLGHLAHLHVPEFHPAPEVFKPEFRAAPEAFKGFPAGELRSVTGRWGGGGVLAGIGGALASVFGALFGRKKDKNAG
jgi:hypothetical protein